MRFAKFLSCALVFTLLFSLICFSAEAAVATTPTMVNVDGITYRISADGTAEITKCNFNKSGEVEIPVVVNDAIVTSIGDYSFQYCEEIASVIIPSSVTHIGYSAFYGCKKLESVSIPDSVEKIEYAAFAKCNSLKNAKIADLAAWCAAKLDGPYANPAHITGKLDFGISMENFVIPSYIGTIGAYTFYGCTDIKSVEISDGISSIGECAFYGCQNLTEVKVPNSVLKIEYGAFSDCDKLSVVGVSAENAYYKNLDGALVELDTQTLIRGYNNTVVPDDGSITIIGAYAFSGCDNITSITIPDCITYIGSSAFKNCSKLSKITLSKGIDCISPAAFSGCEQLSDIVIPENVTRICSNAFRYCNSITEIKLHDKITEIGNFAFADCKALTGLNVPSSIQKMGEGVVSGSTAVTLLTVEPGSYYYSADNCIIREGSVIAGCKASRIPVDGSITMIGNYAFAGQTDLTQVAITKSVENIGISAFNGCTALQKVYYGSDESDWNGIKLSSENEPLLNAEKLYNNTDMPATSYQGQQNQADSSDSSGNGIDLWLILVIVGAIIIVTAAITIVVIKLKKPVATKTADESADENKPEE